MKSRLLKTVIMMGMLMLCVPIVFGQKREKLVKKWLAEDIEELTVVSQVPSSGEVSKELLATITGRPGHLNELEFGAQRYSNSLSGGYVIITTSIVSYRGRQLSYTVYAMTSVPDWQLIRERYLNAWNSVVGLPFTETSRGIVHERVDQEVLSSYKQAVAEVIGAQRNLAIPEDLKDEYELLTAPFGKVVVSEELCGYGGQRTAGQKAIQEILRADRPHLLENVLRGYNQGGRTLAAIALLKMKKEGRVLGPDVEENIRTVIDLDIPIDSCSGCFQFDTTARELVERYKLN